VVALAPGPKSSNHFGRSIRSHPLAAWHMEVFEVAPAPVRTQAVEGLPGIIAAALVISTFNQARA
jgi:hypothetical protein